MFVGKNDPFPPLTSASPRLLFDFFPTLMSPSDKGKTHTEHRRTISRHTITTKQGVLPDSISLIFQAIFPAFFSITAELMVNYATRSS